MLASDAGGLCLKGLDGGNPLAFLAVIGTLRTVALADPAADWRIRWRVHNGTWISALSSNRVVSREELVEVLTPALRYESTPEFDFAQNLNVSPEAFRRVAGKAQYCASRRDRRYADFVASFSCELLVETQDRNTIQNTALRTMSGAGHQHFLGTMKQLLAKTDADHLHRSLFETWDYSDEKLGLRWDPEEDRRYALRWDNPSGDAIKTMRGANRLAVEALPLLPTVPGDRQLDTTGFSNRDRAWLFAWPIWEDALSVDVVRSLLALSEIQKPEPDRANLQALGVVETYRSQRITVGKYRNFTGARPA